MPLPTSGPLSLNDIQTEFGGTNPISLSEYYAGGANVPAGTSGTFGAVPSSGTISIQNFYGTSKATLALVGAFANVIDFSPVTIGLGYQLTSGGKEQDGFGTASSISFNDLGDWVVPNGSANLYEVRATVNSGAVTTGTTGSWLSLGTTRTWTLTRSTVGISSVNLTIDIRLIGGTTILATGNVDFTAELQ
jgi:hypothetical protein